jgi:hypothetical protein
VTHEVTAVLTRFTVLCSPFLFCVPCSVCRHCSHDINFLVSHDSNAWKSYFILLFERATIAAVVAVHDTSLRSRTPRTHVLLVLGFRRPGLGPFIASNLTRLRLLPACLSLLAPISNFAASIVLHDEACVLSAVAP